MRALVQCTSCGSRVSRQLSDFEEFALRRDGFLRRTCGECMTQTNWRVYRSETSSREAPEAAAAPGGGVLLVGNDLTKLRPIQTLVESCGAEAEIASGFDEALTRITRTDFELIVSQHQPPTFDVIRLLMFAKRHCAQSVPQVCFILTVAAADEELRLITQAGAVCFSNDCVLSTLQRHTHGHQA